MRKTRKSLKRMLAAVVCLLVLTGASLTCFAAPVAGDGGNSATLISVKRPETQVSGSTKTICPISGVSSNGVVVSIWKKDPATGAYNMLTNADGTQFKVTVGASGLFYFNIPLTSGPNNIAICGQGANGTYQNLFYTINLIDPNQFNDIFKGWF